MDDRSHMPKARVLVVDDNEANRALAQCTLEDEGYAVLLACGGAEGVSAFARERPDCVVLDVRMPEVDGFEACVRIRALPDGAETPILFLTALRDVDTFDRALRAGGDDFLTKPIQPPELVVRVQTALELRLLRLELRGQYDLLKHQRDALLRLQLQKERLTSFVVHDLKNPVNAMDLHAQLILRERGLPAIVYETMTQIRAESKQLGRMILNLLDLAKADEGQLTPRYGNIDLRALVNEVVAELQVNAGGRKIVLEEALETDRLHGDEDLFRRTLTNLVENAIRYAPAASRVTVTATRLVGGTEIRVADVGAGIAPEMREKVFDPFVQVDSGGEERTVARAGRGLGLTFCRAAVEAHGGRIWVEDGAPGAVFCLSVPNGRKRAGDASHLSRALGAA